MRKLPEGPSMSRAHIPFGKIGFWPDTDDTDRHRTNKEIRALLYNSPFGAISEKGFIHFPAAHEKLHKIKNSTTKLIIYF